MNKKVLLYLPAAAAGVYIAIRYSEECTRGISLGISFCVGVLIPSLFLFMVIAAFVVRSDPLIILTKPLTKVSRLLFGLPAVSLSAILLAVLGGYPIGGRCAGTLYEQGALTEKQAQKTAYTAAAAGPGFVVNYIGLALLNSKKAGTILLAAQILAVLFTGIIVGKVIPCEKEQPPFQPVTQSGSLIVDAVSDASKGAFSMCATVIVFCAVNEVASTIFFSFPKAVQIFSGLLEVTTGVNQTARLFPLWATAFYVGFGGLSVHFQIFASLKNVRIKKRLFFLFRLIQGIFAGIFTYILVGIFPETQAVFSTAKAQTAAISGTVWGSAALILSLPVFLGSISQGGKYVRNRRYHGNRL